MAIAPKLSAAQIGAEVLLEDAYILQVERTETASIAVGLASAKFTLDKVRLVEEARIVREAGGEKELGSNEEARKRTLQLGLLQSADYLNALSNVTILKNDLAYQEVKEKYRQDLLRVHELIFSKAS